MSGKRASSMREVMRNLADSVNEGLRVGFTAEVVSWSMGPPATATLRPCAKNPRKNEQGGTTYEQLPDLPNCPVLYPGGGGFSIVWPLQAGDRVYVLIPDTSEAEVQGGAMGAGPAEPADPRRHDLSDAVCIPMTGSITEPDAVNATAAIFRGDEVRLGNGSATSFVALATDVDSNLNDVEAIVNDLVAWANACRAAGSYQDPAAVLPTYSRTSTAATKVKAE